jgi:hypothetical protein
MDVKGSDNYKSNAELGVLTLTQIPTAHFEVNLMLSWTHVLSYLVAGKN